MKIEVRNRTYLIDTDTRRDHEFGVSYEIRGVRNARGSLLINRSGSVHVWKISALEFLDAEVGAAIAKAGGLA